MTVPTRHRNRPWTFLLLLPYIALLFPSFYAKHDPTLWGFPFFYWYQFLWVILAALLTGLVYWLNRRGSKHA